MTRNTLKAAVVAMAMALVACGGGKDSKDSEVKPNPNAPVPPASVISEKTHAEAGEAKFYGNIMWVLESLDDAPGRYDLVEVLTSEATPLRLEKDGGRYLVKGAEGEMLPDIYDDATLEFGKVGGQTVAVWYAKDRTPIWTMVGFDSDDAYNDYRRACFLHTLEGTFKTSEGQKVTITAKGNVSGLFGEDNAPFEFSLVNNYVAELGRLAGTGKYFGLAVKDYGIDLLDTEVDEEVTGERMATDEVVETLEREGEPDIAWVDSHLLTSDYITYVASAERKRMIERLKAVEKPTQVQAWNLFVLESFQGDEQPEEHY